MSLFLDCLLPGASRPLRAEALAGTWVTLADERADAVLAVLDGSGPGAVGILLDGRQIAGTAPDARVRDGFALAASRLEDVPVLRLVDVVALGVRSQRPALWQTAVGSSTARTSIADDEALARALAGRMGLSQWLDDPAIALTPKLAALADVTRALAGMPLALLWRRPDWLPAGDQDDIAQAVAEEQQRQQFAVVELTANVG